MTGSSMRAMVLGANEDPNLERVFSTWATNNPQVFLNIANSEQRHMNAIDGLITRFEPDFDLGSYLVESCSRAVRWAARCRRYTADRLLDLSSAGGHLLQDGPQRGLRLLDRLSSGELPVRVEPRTGSFLRVTAIGLQSHVVTALHADPAGRFWIGTSGGLKRLRRLDEATGRAQLDNYSERNGLPSKVINGIRSDAAGALCIQGRTGLQEDQRNETQHKSQHGADPLGGKPRKGSQEPHHGRFDRRRARGRHEQEPQKNDQEEPPDGHGAGLNPLPGDRQPREIRQRSAGSREGPCNKNQHEQQQEIPQLGENPPQRKAEASRRHGREKRHHGQWQGSAVHRRQHEQE